MRRLIGTLAVLGGLLVLAPSQAQALATVQILWASTGTDSILANPGDVLPAQIVLTAGAEGISSYSISLSFDDELNLIDVQELAPPPLSNITVGPGGTSESEPGTPGAVLSLEAATLGAGPVSTPFLAAIVIFQVVAPLEDGADVTAGLFNTGVDGIFSNAGDDLGPTAEFGTASVALIPEPGTVALLGLGLAAMAARRRA